MARGSEYGQQSISSLKEEQQVRQRPAVIFGTNDEYGAAHGIYEIIANAIDEAREGYGDQVRVSIYKDGSVEVSDDGRGIPMDWNEREQKYNWELVFTTLYASGKYDNSSYGASLGLNGLGATAMQFASEFMEVASTRDGKTYLMRFEKGRPVGELQIVEPIRKGTGTTIRFKPDPDVFINIKNSVMTPEYYINLLRRQAMLHEGLEIVLFHEELGKEIVLKYDEGMAGFVKDVISKPMTKEPLVFEGYSEGTDDPDINPDPYRVDMRLILGFSRETNLCELYHNGSHLYEGGVTYEALKFGLMRGFEDYAKEIGKLTGNERLAFGDIESVLVAVGDTNAPGNRTFFKNQTKAAINNPFIGNEYSQFVYNNIRSWLANDRQSERVLEEILTNRKARIEASKVTRKVVRTLNKGVSGLGNKPDKFVDCRSKIPHERELFIVEGDSALGSCKLSRDASFQAIMPVRGKIINCLKEDLTRILSNEIIIDLLRVLGCGVEVKSKYIKDLPKFDIDKLNWGKVIICTDADLDGMQIRCLILAMIYRLCPSLLKMGKVYIAETPLYEINHKKDTFFAYSDNEKDSILKKLEEVGAKEGNIKVQRSKGLGENDPEMMSVSTMAPETRRLIKVEYPENDEDVANYFNALLGDDIETRRILINEYFELTSVDID